MSIRGSCPGLSVPMQTGDGLLARLIVHEPVSLSKLTALCLAAERYGNGIVEITQRGNLQVRGLNETTAPEFAREVAALRIGADEGPPLVTSPLLGLDVGEPFDSTALIAALFDVFRDARSALKSLSPKVSVLVDGGGRLHLDAINADIRLVATSDRIFRLSLAGTASDAKHVGYVSLEQAPRVVAKLLVALAGKGPNVRARDLPTDSLELPVSTDGSPSASDGRLGGACGGAPKVRPPADPFGIHILKDDNRALGVALPFGHTTTVAFQRIIQAAAHYGATSIRLAPGRALLIIGVSQSAAQELRGFLAREEDLVVDNHDARRHVIACAGAPACASAQLSTRQLAPEVARLTQAWAGTSKIVHLAGCSKGCAHPGVATLTVVGPDRIVLNGRAGDGCASGTCGALSHQQGDGATVGLSAVVHNSSALLGEIERLCREL